MMHLMPTARVRYASPIVLCIAALLAGVGAQAVALSVIESEPRAFGVYITAQRENHGQPVTAAEQSDDPVVHFSGEVVARWFTINRQAVDEIRKTEGLVVRESPTDPEGHQLLVLIDENPITETHLRAVMSTVDAYGRPGIGVSLSEEGARHMRALTEANMGRRVALVINDQVQVAVTISTSVGAHLVVTGYETEHQRDQAMNFLLRLDLPDAPFRPAAIVALVVVGLSVLMLLGFCVLAIMPTGGYAPLPASRAWTVLGGIGGLLAGAYNLGIDKTTTGVNGSDAIVLHMTYHISLLWLGIGAVLGCLVGIVVLRILRWMVLRAFHNAKRVITVRG